MFLVIYLYNNDAILKHLSSISVSILFFASTIGITFHVNLHKADKHTSTTKPEKKIYHKYRNPPQDKLVLVKDNFTTQS